MREQLQLEIVGLLRQVQGYTDQLEQTEYGTAKHDAIKSELGKVEAKLAAKQEALAEIDGAAQIAQEELFSQFDNIEVAGLPFSLRDLAKGPDEYSIISAYFQSYVGDMAQQHAAVISSYKSQIEDKLQEVERVEGERDEWSNMYKSSKVEFDLLQEKLNECEKVGIERGQEIDRLKTELFELNIKVSDVQRNRDNAARQLEEARAEIERLETTVKPVQTNINTNAAEIAKKLHDQKPAIYNVRWEQGVGFRTHKLANLAETGEEIRYHYFEEGKYRELSEDEVIRFRTELNNKKAIEAAEAARMVEEANNNKTLVTPPTLPSQGAGHELDQGEPIEVGTVVTREEFKALEARVAIIEQNQQIGEKAAVA